MAKKSKRDSESLKSLKMRKKPKKRSACAVSRKRLKLVAKLKKQRDPKSKPRTRSVITTDLMPRRSKRRRSSRTSRLLRRKKSA